MESGAPPLFLVQATFNSINRYIFRVSDLFKYFGDSSGERNTLVGLTFQLRETR